MTNPLNLDTVDVDGAVREMGEAAGFGRADFLRKGALAGGGILIGGAFAGPALAQAQGTISRRKSNANDVRILNFALTLEFLEAKFYEEALQNNAFSNDQFRKFGEIVEGHEQAHVTFLRRVLGRAAIREPRFDFGATVTDPAMFAETAQVLEDTGVTAYLGQVNNVRQAAVLGAAGTIATVEARHAAWIRFLNAPATAGTPRAALPSPATFDRRVSQAGILRAVGGTGFIQ